MGETNFQPREFPRSGSKAEDGEREKRKREKRGPNDGNNNGQATHGARKHPWRTQAAWAKSLDTKTWRQGESLKKSKLGH